MKCRKELFFMSKHKESIKILFTTLITFLCGMLVYTGGRYVYAQNKSDSDNLSITVVGKGSVEYTIDDTDYEVTEGATVYQTVPAEKEVKIQVKSEENNTIDTISCNGDDVENVSGQNTWEETVKFDKDTVKDYKIIFKEAAKSADTQSQDASEDVTAPENAVATEESKDVAENESGSSATAQENSEQVSESDVKENEEKDFRLKDLNIDFNVTDISEETKLIIKAYQSGVYDDKTQIEARKKKAEETKLDKYCDDDYFLTDAYYKKYSEKMLMYDNCVILSRNSTKNVIKENEKEADKYAAKYDKAIQSNSEENSNKVQESFISRLFKARSVSAANLSVIDHSYHQAWQGGGYISNGIWRLSNNHLSFCADGLGAEPSNGSSGPDNIVNSSNLRKALYYGYGGPGDCLTRRLGTSASIAWTDDLVSMAYTGHSVGSVAVGGYHWRIAGQSYWNEIMSKPDPIQYGYVAHVVSINGGGYNWQGVWKAKQPLAYGVYNPKGKLKVQKSSANTSFVSGKSGYTLAGAVYSIYSDSGCTKKVGSVSTDANGNSNTIELNNGTYYVKETTPPAGYNLDTNVKPVTIATGQTSSVSSSEQPGGAIRIIKKSDNEKLTSGNSGYSLSGAKYGVYTDSGCTKLVQTITTGPNGVSGYFGVAGASKYYIKELKASDGYQLNPKVYTATVNGLVSVDVNVTETPQILKKPLLIHKTDAKSNALADAQFEVKFYKGIVTNDSSKLSGTPLTWHLKSDSNGDIYLDSAHLVSGKSNSAFLTDGSGNPVLTVGTVTVKETQTPGKDYKLDENTYLIQIQSNSDSSALTYSGKKAITDASSYPSKLKIFKFGGSVSNFLSFSSKFLLEGTQFRHTKPDGSTEIITYKRDNPYTGGNIFGAQLDNVCMELKNLSVGIHTLKEVKVGENIIDEEGNSTKDLGEGLFALNPAEIKFEVKKDGSIRLLSKLSDGSSPFNNLTTVNGTNGLTAEIVNDTMYLGIRDPYHPYNLKIKKLDSAGNPMSNITFDVYGGYTKSTHLDNGDFILDVPYYIGRYTTDSNGELTIQNIDRDKYSDVFLTELNCPSDMAKDYIYQYIRYDKKIIRPVARINTEYEGYDTSSKTVKFGMEVYVGSDGKNKIWETLDTTQTAEELSKKKSSFSGDLSKSFTLNVPITNYNNPPKDWEIKKLDAGSGNAISGIKFTLYGIEDEYSENGQSYNYFKKTYITDDDGKIHIKDLRNGTYYISEDDLNLPNDYEKPTQFEAQWNGQTIKYIQELSLNSLTNFRPLNLSGYEGYMEAKTGEDSTTVFNVGDENSVYAKENGFNWAYYTQHENENYTIHSMVVNQRKHSDLVIQKQSPDNKPLKGVEFTLYSDEACAKPIASKITDKEGIARFKDVFTVGESKTYYMKETKAPKNIKLPKSFSDATKDAVWTITQTYEKTKIDTSTYDSNISYKQEYTYKSVCTALRWGNGIQSEDGRFLEFDNRYLLRNIVINITNSYKTPKSLYIRKISAGSLDTYDDNLSSGIGNYLDGTTFTHTLPNGKTETLTYKSDSSTNDTEKKEGFMKITNLTQGKHTIQENTPANSLYSKNPNKLEFTVNSDGSIDFSKSDMSVLGGTDTNKIYAVSESADDTSNKLMVTFEDEFSPTKLRIHKTDIGGRALKGAVFTIYGDKDFSETVDTATSDVDGNVLFTKELKNDKEYWVKETQVPNGYQVAYNQYGAPMTYKIMIHTDKDGKKVFINNELVWNNDKNTDLGKDYKVSVTNGASSSQMDMTVINMIPVKSQKSFKFTVHKTNNAGQSLAGAKFTLYMERGCYTPIATGTTNSNGEITFANIFNDKVSEFYMKEIEAPSGYKLPTNEDGSEKVWKIQATMDSNDKVNVYIDDEPVVASESVTSIGNSKYAGKFSTSNGSSYALQVNIKNYRLGLLNALPNTGSIMTVVLIVVGMCLVGLAIVKKKNR